MTNRRGGYKPRAGRGRKGYYADIWCESTYEMAFVWHCITHGKKIERVLEGFPYVKHDGTAALYYPDFIVDNGYVEVKGWMRPNDQQKLNYFPHPISLLIGDDIKNIVTEAKKHFKVNDLSVLYSERLHPHSKTCENCQNTFGTRFRKARFCSKKCSGQFTSQKRVIQREGKSCLVCGVDISKKRSEQQTCSKICSSSLMWENRKRENNPKRCENCKLPFPTGAKGAKYCSRPCFHQSHYGRVNSHP